MLSKVPPHLEVDPKTGYTFSKFVQYPYNQPMHPDAQVRIANALNHKHISDGPITRGLERKAQLRKETELLAQKLNPGPITNALKKKSLLRKVTEAFTSIVQKASITPQKLFKCIK